MQSPAPEMGEGRAKESKGPERRRSFGFGLSGCQKNSLRAGRGRSIYILTRWRMSKLDNRQVMGQENLVGERSRTRSAKAKSALRWISRWRPTVPARNSGRQTQPNRGSLLANLLFSAVPETRLMMQSTWSQWAACEQCIWTRNNHTHVKYYTILKQIIKIVKGTASAIESSRRSANVPEAHPDSPCTGTWD